MQECDDLYAITNGNPLLIRWTVGQLGREGSHCRTITDACQFLNSGILSKNNDPLEYIFGDLLDTFNPSETAVLAALTYFTQPARIEWVAMLGELYFQVAQTALEDLVDRSILTSDAGRELFYLPTLAAKFLRLARPDAILQTGDRLANRAYAITQENGYIEYERFPMLEAEWPLVEAAWPRLVLGENNRLQAVRNALRKFLEFSGRWDELLTLSLQAEEKAIAAQDFINAGWCTYTAISIFSSRSLPNEASACAERCASHWKKASWTGSDEKAYILRLRGAMHLSEENYPAAIDMFREELSLRQTITLEDEEVARTFQNLALVEHVQACYDSAERDYDKALRIAIKINNRELIASVTTFLADLENDRKDWERAEKLAREALEYTEKIGCWVFIGENCLNLIEALTHQGKFAESLPYAYLAVKMFTKIHQLDELHEANEALKKCQEGQVYEGSHKD